MRRALPAILLVLAVVGGAFLRFDGLAEPSFWLDEILGYDLTTESLSLPLTSWLSGFEGEHGPLFYGTQLMARVSPSPEFSGRLAPAFFGMLTLLVMWLAATAVDKSELVTLGTVVFLVISPLHVYYSREARPYALLLLLAASLLGALLTRLPAWSIALLLLATVYTSATGFPVLVAVAIAALAGGVFAEDRELRRRDLVVAALAALACGLVPLVYGGEARTTPEASPPPLDLEFFDRLMRSFSVTAIDGPSDTIVAIGVLAFAAVGMVDLIRRNVRQGIIVLLMTVIPGAVAIAALVQFHHFYSVRYIASGLLGYALLAGAGIAAIARLTRWAQWFAAVIILGLLAWRTVPASRNEPFQKLDWRLIASTIWSHAHEGDRVFTAESWSTVSLRFYLDRLPERVRMAQVFPVEIADLIAANERPIWIVSAGYLPDVAVRNWACRFPILLGSSLELFRLHYAPAVEHFLEARSTAVEWRAWTAGGSKTGMLRIAEWELAGIAPYLDQNTAWRLTKSPRLPATWNDEAVSSLAARLGFDPATALGRVKSGAVDVEDLAEWIAPASQCLDDQAFVRRAYELLLQRAPAAAEEQGLITLLKSGRSRPQIIRTIVQTEEFLGSTLRAR